MAVSVQKTVLNAGSHLDGCFRQELDKCLTSTATGDDTMKSEERSLLNQLRSALNVKDNKAQIVAIKQICDNVKDVYKSEDENSRSCLPLELLINLYLNCPPKHPVKRYLASTFQNYPRHIQTSIQSNVQKQTHFKMEEGIKSAGTESVDQLRKHVNMLASLMENFKMGEECLKCVAPLAFKFLSTCLMVFSRHYSNKLSPVKQNETMHHCLVTLQTTNRMLQKCHGEIAGMFLSDRPSCDEISQCFVSCDVQILERDNFMLDCKCACGMNIALLLKFNNDGHSTSEVVRDLFFDKNTAAVPDWLEGAGMTRGYLDNLSSSSLLCLNNGLLAMLDVEDLVTQLTNTKTLIFMFPEIFLEFRKICSDTSSKLMAGKSICLWTIRAQACLKSGKVSSDTMLKFQGQGVTMQNILHYVWATWEDTVDAIRMNSRDVFHSFLKIHTLATNKDTQDDLFLKDLACMLILDVSWSCKGKFGSLCSLISHVNTTYFLSVNRSMPSDILLQMREQTLSCYASELYLKLCEAHQKEETNTWMSVWMDPVLEVLSGTNRLQKLHVIEYILPSLLKNGKKTLQYVVDKLSPAINTGAHELGALVTCLRRARGMGLLKCQASESPECLYGVVRVEVVKQALTSIDEQVRLDALALLCENQRTAEIITATEFNLLRYYLPWNLNNQSPSFRQYMLAHLKKLFYRLGESEGVLLRNLKQKNKKQDLEQQYLTSLSHYQNFLIWILGHLFHCLPGSTFARRTTCLNILSIMVDLLGKSRSADDSRSFNILSHIHSEHLQSLMECLTDTFEDNKQEATKILQFSCVNGRHIQPTLLEESFTTALTMAASPRPQDCTTAAYMFRVLLLMPGFSELLRNADSRWSKLITNSPGNTFNLPNVLDDQSESSLLLLWILLVYLKDQKEVAKTSLIMAAANRPMYPTLHCIRYILFDMNLSNISSQTLHYWQDLVQNLITDCLEISEIVSPVVHNSSPEGNVPVETIRGPGLNFDAVLQSDADKALMLEAEEKSKQTVMLMPEYLVVCCWRNIKEVSLLLGQLNLAAPVTDPHSQKSPGLLSCDQIRVMGDYFSKQLLESKHRGAFELAYAGFVKMTEMLWKSNIPELHCLPSAWLQEVMIDIRSEDPRSRLCATRRSAGVPFYVQTLVTTEPPSTGRTCFKQAMADLLQMALQDSKDRETASNPQVHALNTLRALFRDTRLGEDVAPFVADGVKAAILGFQSPFWAVRNSSTLLLSAMMTRVFGVKRSKDENNMSRKNCQTGRAFFHKYPSLYKFLLDQLAEATQNIGGEDGVLHLHPALYPVLMVLGRLFPSHLEGTDTTLNLAAFIPHIIRCCCSPVFKTRIMSAKALCPLVLHDQLTSVLNQLLSMLPDLRSQPHSQNLVHGVLLQVSQLLTTVPATPLSVRTVIQTDVSSLWMKNISLATRNNPCFITRSEALTVSYLLVGLFQNESDMSGSLLQVQKELYNVLLSEIETVAVQQSVHYPGFTQYTTNVARLALLYCTKGDNSHTEHVLSKCLKSAQYEVRLIALEYLEKIFCDEAEEEHNSEIVNWDDCKSVMAVVEGSVLILDQLRDMAFRAESHPECVVKVFKVLSYHPSMRTKKDNFAKVSHIQILKQCIDIMADSARDDIRGEVTHFTGCLIAPAIESVKDSQESKEDLMFLLQQWLNLLSDYSSTEQSSQLQLSCIKVIGQNVQQLLVDPDNFLGDFVFRFWTIVMDLLQEDDSDVKHEAASLISHFHSNTNSLVHPFLSVDAFLNHMVSLFGGGRTLGCLTTLVSWIKGHLEETNVAEERLFDRGEMNTYREDIVFVQLVTRHLAQFLIALAPDVTSTHGRDINMAGLQNMLEKISSHFPSAINELHLDTDGQPSSCWEEFESHLCEVVKELMNKLEEFQEMSLSFSFLEVSQYKSFITNVYRTQMLADVARCLRNDKLSDICVRTDGIITSKLNNNCVCNTLISTNVQYV